MRSFLPSFLPYSGRKGKAEIASLAPRQADRGFHRGSVRTGGEHLSFTWGWEGVSEMGTFMSGGDNSGSLLLNAYQYQALLLQMTVSFSLFHPMGWVL
jgi:hypothetical protein